MTPPQVLWQTDQAMVVIKPVGIATQAPPGIDSLESRLRGWLGEDHYIAMVHRLDRPVGGLVLVAKTKRAARLLSEQLASGKVVKTYRAIASGVWNANDDDRAEPSVWCDWIRKVPDQPRCEIVSPGTAGAKEAITEVTWHDYDASENETRLTLVPKTGRMHQLRVQAAARGLPLRGDSIYGPRADGSAENPPTAGRPRTPETPAVELAGGIERAGIGLRAVSLRFFDPRSGRLVSVAESP